eukprot:TRINITY_DN30646_c0_g1_i1.p1 TRINITY_DN30646_c0_g1~~TRINITY_DN30646_c0_g1_i1.p1  ORF type:complete len:673 (+),score=182.41 TRINITY_DN30646_c0_g1_i1:411-2429(+)
MEAKMIRGYIRRGSIVLGMGFCSFFLYRLFPSSLVYRFLPSLFGFLVSSSPVIICTALLLGTLLTFGQQNVPHVKEQEIQTPVSSLRAQSVAGDLVVKKAARVEEKGIKEAGFGKGIEDVYIGKGAVIEDNGKEINWVKEIEMEKKGLSDDFKGHSNDHHKETAGQRFNVHNDSGSDEEISSPDVSVTDVMPILDELQSLIETKAPIPTLTPQDESDAQESDIGSADLVGGVENANEEAQEKATMTWTVDDHKNIKEIGTLELERNLRLESLIAKRRARKRWMVEAERNLMDFNSNDEMQISLPPRRNPFDPPYDSDETTGLSPIPGSAPSFRVPRFNPFDLPFDQDDELGNPKGEKTSQQEFVMPLQRDMFFRRYESFTLGASFLGEAKQEKHDFRFRPHFEPEGTGHERKFKKQLSVRRVPKSQTVPASSTTNKEDDNKDLLEPEIPPIGESNSVLNYERIGRESESSEGDLVEIVSNPSDAIEAAPNVGTSNQGEEGVEDGQAEEPVCDSSPSATSISLSNMTAVSETLSDAPPVTVDGGILHGDRESMTDDENETVDMGSNDEGSWVELAKLHSVDENESRSRGLKEVSKCNVIQVGTIPEAVLGQFSPDVSLSPPVAKSEQGGVMDSKINHQYIEAQVPPSFNRETNLFGLQTAMVDKADAEDNHRM